MHVLLPPSETKRAGGDGAALALDALALPGLRAAREAAIDALVALCADEEAAAKALKLSARQRGEIATNLVVREAPTMPAVDRFTGVLFDALDAGSLDEGARGWLSSHALIQTALLGPVRASDPLPAFRLSAGHRLPGLPTPVRHWSAAAASALGEELDAFALDLRSEAYRALAPLPAETSSVYVRVVTESTDGAVRALNHFNKKAKGQLARALAETRCTARDVAELTEWGAEAGFAFRAAEADGEVLLVARDDAPAARARAA
ncbi:YaaA family protein [Microbacterium sp. gxy059]|uniref:YaaA family protein n=1 Tax=Microbacterium sp. gxy059 TaxID=2957199 RepID=UPI003D987AD5